MAKKPSPRKQPAARRAGTAPTSRRPPPQAAKKTAAAATGAGKRKVPAPTAKPKLKLPTRRVGGARAGGDGATAVDPAGVAQAKALEALDAAEPAAPPAQRAAAAASRAGASFPLRNADFPRTYIKEIQVSLNDPDHPMILSWTGPQSGTQETGPFRTSPGAGLKGLNCDNAATSRRSGTYCTPKGTHTVSGFRSRLNSDARATFVTWFVRARGIALHYFPSVPRHAASHGCVRIESKRVAQLIQENARAGLTKVIVDGTWTKPAKQW